MTLSAFLFQALNGLSTASGLFFVAVGLSLIFGVTRIINIAHGSLYMLGTYIAYSFATRIGGALGFWGGIVATAIVVGAHRRADRDRAAAADLPRARAVPAARHLRAGAGHQRRHALAVGPGRSARAARARLARRDRSARPPAAELRPVPDLHRPRWCCWSLHFALARTRFGRLVRAATQDREMVGALGVNQAMLFTAVFALGAALAGLGGALQVAREPANLATDLVAIGDAFVVVVVGGMGSITRRLSRRRHHRRGESASASASAWSISASSRVNFSKLTLVAEFLVMAVVLIARPYGLLGRAQAAVRSIAEPEDPIRPATPALKALGARRAGAAAVPAAAGAKLALSADPRHRRADRGDLRHLAAFHHGAGRHAFVRPRRLFRPRRLWRGAAGEMAAPSPMGLALAAAPLVALAGALLFGWFAVRLSGVYLAMLTLGLRADRLGGGVPVGGAHRRLQRRDRRVAAAAVRQGLGLFPAHAGAGGGRACCCCGAFCSRRSAMPCAPGAIRRCAPKPSASTSSACIGSALPLLAASAAWPAGCSPSPRARSRRKPSTSAAPSTAW